MIPPAPYSLRPPFALAVRTALSHPGRHPTPGGSGWLSDL
jgi:hypothetical protein